MLVVSSQCCETTVISVGYRHVRIFVVERSEFWVYHPDHQCSGFTDLEWSHSDSSPSSTQSDNACPASGAH